MIALCDIGPARSVARGLLRALQITANGHPVTIGLNLPRPSGNQNITKIRSFPYRDGHFLRKMTGPRRAKPTQVWT